MTSPSDTMSIDAIARAFVDARRMARMLPAFPGAVPPDLATAYRVQDRAMGMATGTVAGWKVGRITPPVEGVDRLAGPIFADTIVAETDPPTAMAIYADGFGAAEAEFLLRIGATPDPTRTHYAIKDAIALIDAVHVGIEIASSPFPGINAHGPMVTISDHGNNNGLVVGAAIPDWRDADLNAWPVTLAVNGAIVGAATAATMLDGPIGAARFLFEHAAARGIALRRGQWISTGAVTGVHPVAPGDRVEARFGHRYGVTCTIKAH